ncbi:MAG TPA: hypothetical protein VKU36_05340 [Candidatus Babeliales bacterium]|nr:hypothetical protein [Candidatus Babeliales bacterium]
MKNTKNILLSLFTITAICSSQSMQSSEFFEDIHNKVAVEIYNKDQRDIGVAIIDLKTSDAYTMVVPSGQARKYDANINSPLRFEIWSPLSPGKALGVFSVNAPGKTKYLTWNPAKYPALYAQTGPLMGLLGKTESGLPLKNNIKSSQIKLEKEQYSQSRLPGKQPQRSNY